MKNFETRYPVNGSSALRPEYDDANSARRAYIIAFPGVKTHQDEETSSPSHHRPQHAASQATVQSIHHVGLHAVPRAHETVRVKDRLMHADCIQSLRYGTAQGVPFNRMKRWQAVVAGSICTAFAFAVLFFTL